MTWTQAVLLTAMIWLAVFSIAWIIKKIVREWHAANIMKEAVAHGDFDESTGFMKIGDNRYLDLVKGNVYMIADEDQRRIWMLVLAERGASEEQITNVRECDRLFIDDNNAAVLEKYKEEHNL